MTIARPGSVRTAHAYVELPAGERRVMRLRGLRDIRHVSYRRIVKLRPNARFSTICLHAGQEPDPVDRRDRHADLSDVHLRAGSARPAQGLRVRAARRTRRAPRSRQPRGASRAGSAAFAFASGMAAINAIATLLEGGRPRHRLRQRLRRHVPAVRAGAEPLSAVVQLRGHRRSRRARARLHAGHADALRRDAEQPDHAPHRSRRRRRSRAPARRPLVVDNTFASPYIQRPIELGADLVIHSTTKYLNGHSDSVGGIVVADARRRHRVAEVRAERRGRDSGPVRRLAGARGTKTLPLRMAQHNANGLALAEFLAAHPKVQRGLLSRACRRIRSTRWRGARCAGSAGCSPSTSARSMRRAGC